MADEYWKDFLSLLRKTLQGMQTGDPIYRIVKEELKKQGHWKDLPRGKPGFKKE